MKEAKVTKQQHSLRFITSIIF